MLMLHALLLVMTTAELASQAPSAEKASVPTISVCEAFSHPEQYDGRIVRIRDRVVGTIEGAGFIGRECPGTVVIEGKEWPRGIAWTMPTSIGSIFHPVNFSFDWDSRNKLEKEWRKLQKRVPDECIDVTYTGMFEMWSRENATKTDAKGHRFEILGFGHLNAAPAQLVLKSADEVAAIPNCSPKK